MHDKRGTGGFAEGFAERDVMPFNGLIFKDVLYARGSKHKSLWATLWWLNVSYLYKLWALELQKAVKGTELHLKDAHPPSNHHPENMLQHIPSQRRLRPCCSDAYGIITIFFPSPFNIPDKTLFNSQPFMTVLGLNEKLPSAPSTKQSRQVGWMYASQSSPSLFRSFRVHFHITG